MPIINENQFFTPIIEFDVAPENQQALIDGIADEVERYFKSYVGFVSASFHTSEDGRRVINYAQWRSKEDWSRATAATSEDETDETGSIILKMISRYATSEGRLDTFRVARVINNQDFLPH